MSDKKKAIKLSTLEAIGAAVRNKEGSTDLIPVNTLADRIAALPSGVNKLPQVIDGTVTEITEEDLAGVTEIRGYAFYGCTGLTSIQFSDSITEIGEHAFEGCSSIETLNIPGNITKTNNFAFDNCKQLKSVTINYGLENIAARLFYRCEKLASITIPNSVMYIGVYAFASCSSLNSLTIPDSVISIGASAFYISGLVNINVGNGLTNIDSNAFVNVYNLTNFTISSPIVQSISFKHSTKLTIDSLKNIINALVDFYGTDDDGKYTLTLNSTCNATLEAEGATAPNGLTWREYALSKGWQLA